MVHGALGNLKRYSKDCHHIRQLMNFRQLYFHEFYEEVDFREGEDQQYFIFIPVDSLKAADELNKLTRFALSSLPGIFKYSPPLDAVPYRINKDQF
jgi:hypothetical protein